jgi:predicted nucleotidyltransferase
MDKETALGLAKQYADLVAHELNPDKIVLFGSALRGSLTDESDIDVAVIFDGFKGDWFGAYTRLSKLRRSVSPYIEPVLLDSADDRSGFVKEVLATGEVIFQQ